MLITRYGITGANTERFNCKPRRLLRLVLKSTVGLPNKVSHGSNSTFFRVTVLSTELLSQVLNLMPIKVRQRSERCHVIKILI